MASPPRSPGGADSSEFTLRLSLTEPENRVKVYSRATTAQLADTRGFPGANTSSISQLLPRTGVSKRAAAAQAHEDRVHGLRERNREILRDRHQMQLEKTLARHRRGREREKDKEHTKFEAMYASVVAEEAGFIQDVEAFMHAQARNEVRKREALHKQWDEAIYQKVQAEINAHLDKRNINDISAKRYALMDEYVRVSNSKAYGLFRDIIIPEEYDPMTAHDDPIKYDSRERFDPCKLELRGAAAELGPASVSGFAKGGDPSHRFPPTMWDKLEVRPPRRLAPLARPAAFPPQRSGSAWHRCLGAAWLPSSAPHLAFPPPAAGDAVRPFQQGHAAAYERRGGELPPLRRGQRPLRHRAGQGRRRPRVPAREALLPRGEGRGG